MHHLLRTLAVTMSVIALSLGCAPEPDATPASEETAASAGCAPGDLETLEAGVLTVATDDPAFPPWVLDNEPESGEGYEAAVAYAVAERLGYSEAEITWERVPFNAAIQPGPKSFDFDINQFSITDERREAVDFSSGYYEVTQAVIATGDSPAADAASLADLADVRLGAQTGTTSFTVIEDVIDPAASPSVFDSNEQAKVALENGQIDALVVDLPTAFFITSAELEDGVIVGQVPYEGAGADAEQFGLVLDKDSPLTDCVSEAVDALREDGTLDALEAEWLAEAADAPVLD